MKVLKSLTFSILVTLLSLFSIQAIAGGATTSPKSNDDYQKEMIVHYVNEYRAKHHLAPLVLNRFISREAAVHSRDMAIKAVPFGHKGFHGRIHRLYKKIKHSNGGAENVAYYKTNAKRLVEEWIASPGHRRNILGNYNLTGVGIAYSKKGWAYYTQIFIRCRTQIG